MVNLIIELAKKNDRYKDLKIVKVVYDTTFCLCTIFLIYPENIENFSDAEKQEIYNNIKNLLNLSGELQIKYNKSFLDKEIVLDKLKSYIDENHSSIKDTIKYDLVDYKKEGFSVYLNIVINSYVYDYLINKQFTYNTANYLNNNFCGQFYLSLSKDESLDFDEKILEARNELLDEAIQRIKIVPRYMVYEIIPLIGDEIKQKPEYIKENTEEKTSIVLAGIVSNMQERTYIPRRNKAKGSNETCNYYNFKLKDYSGQCNCIYFANKTSQKKWIKVGDGSNVLLTGDFRKGRNSELTFWVKNVSFCVIPEQEEVVEKRKDNKKSFDISTYNEYSYVFPKEYIKYSQNDIFTKDNEYPKAITENTYVVFDVETTGLNPKSDELTEIGAVKIKNGKIVEQFQSLIKPKGVISREITNITHITNEMVANCPSEDVVIKDFYLFAKNCILVGHNVNFDFQFIQETANRCGFAFDNDKQDTMMIARQKIYSSNYKLGTLAKLLEIPLIDAHRALNDATATAYIFLQLSLK